MDIWDEIKKLTGYQSGSGGVDSYGVDHSGFSLRDELEYQNARQERENLLAQNFDKQGIAEENYPQYGTDFWGGSAENNYGFGTTNIKQNIENVTNRLNSSGTDNDTNNGQVFVNSDYMVNTESLVGNTPPPSTQTQNNSIEHMTNYPELREDKRNTFNSVIESFVRKSNTPSSDNSFINQIVGAASDLGENYINMVNANYKSTPEMIKQGKTIDNYYHCIGNYDAAQRGTLGSATASAIGLGRELIDYPKNVLRKGKTFQQANDDFRNDMRVNADGRQMSQSGQYRSASEACDKYRPDGYDSLDRFRYYKK